MELAAPVERYLTSIVAHRWEELSDCLTSDVVRVGPYGDTYRGKADYVAFLSSLMPSLPAYEMVVERIVYGQGRRFATAQLCEIVEVAGKPLRTNEVLVFDMDEVGRIEHIAIYLRQPRPPPAPPTARPSAC